MFHCCFNCYYGRIKGEEIYCTKWEELYKYNDICWEYHNEGE